MSPWPPRTNAWTSSTETPSSIAMNVRNRAESRTPAMPMTRSRGKPEACHRDVAHRVERVGDDDDDRVGRHGGRAPARRAPTIPAFVASRSSRLIPGFRGDARGHDDDVRAGGVRVVVGAGDPRVVADDRGRLGEVEALALGQALDDVHEHDVGQPGLRDALGGGGADVPGADDGDLVAGHGVTAPRAQGASWRRGRASGCGPGILGRAPGQPAAPPVSSVTPVVSTSIGPASRTASGTPSA